MAELTVRRTGMQVGDIVSTEQGPLVVQRHGAGSAERSTLIGVVQESVSQGKWKVLFTGETESRVMDKRNLRLEESCGTIAEDRGAATGVPAEAASSEEIAAAALLEASTGQGHSISNAGEEIAFNLDREERCDGDAGFDAADLVDLDGTPCQHAKKRREADLEMAAHAGKKYTTSGSMPGIVWTVEKDPIVLDDFKEHSEVFKKLHVPSVDHLLGDAGTEKGWNVLLVALFLLFLPGSISILSKKMGAALAKNYSRRIVRATWNDAKFITFLALVIGGTCCGVVGAKNFFASCHAPERRMFEPAPPGFENYMGRSLFGQCLACLKYLYADQTGWATNPWETFLPCVRAFNENRARHCIGGMVFNLDESMSSHRPRTTKHGRTLHGTPDMPNISFIERKPKPFGTELKCMVEAAAGIMMMLLPMMGKVRARLYCVFMSGGAALTLSYVHNYR